MSSPFDGPQRPASRRTTTIVTVSFAALLCVVGLVLAYRSLTGVAEDVDLGAPPSLPPSLTEQEPVAPGTQAPAPAEDRVAFSSPTGNIGCVLSSAGARCDIAERAWEPPAKPEECQANWGQGLVVGEAGTQFVCAADSALGAPDVLAYGTELVRGEYRCRSEQDGMRCSGPGGGFVIARAGYQLL
ncbi:MAG: DUF6636 domain-containing protein [Actinomycetota bacterium]